MGKRKLPREAVSSFQVLRNTEHGKGTQEGEKGAYGLFSKGHSRATE